MKYFTTLLLGVFIAIPLFSQDIPRTFYVLNGLGQSVSKMNIETEVIENNISTVGSVANRIYTHNNFIYVVNSVPDGITVIDPNSNRVTDNISLTTGSNPWDMAFVGTNRAYVTNWLANSISVVNLDSGEEENTIEVGTAPEGILVVDNTAYVCNSGGYPNYSHSTVSIIDVTTNSVTKTLDVLTNPQDLALGPNGNIYVVCTGNYIDTHGKIVEINPFGDSDYTALVTDTIDIGGTPTDIIVTNTGIAYLADFGDGNNGFIYAYNVITKEVLNDNKDPILVGNGAMALLYDNLADNIYVNNFSDDAVQMLNSADGTVIETFLFGDGAQHMAILEAINSSDPWADAVVKYTPGTGAGFGQNFYSNNILGPPDPDPLLNEYNPSNKPQELLSLGEDGEIILEFTDNYIVDGEGIDFTVFENAFYFFGTTDPFIEAAFVAVSMDGENWFEFPWDTTTWEGFAGVTPMYDSQNPTDAENSGGDQFDLKDLGLPYAKFIKLTDLGDLKKEGPFNGDFDLDAVVAVNSMEGQPTSIDLTDISGISAFSLQQNYPNPFNPTTAIEYSLRAHDHTPLHVNLAIYNLLGQKVATLVNQNQQAGSYRVEWDASGLAGGIYLYRLKAGNKFVETKRLVFLK
jgi:YVTN family beta-propeller protein